MRNNLDEEQSSAKEIFYFAMKWVGRILYCGDKDFLASDCELEKLQSKPLNVIDKREHGPKTTNTQQSFSNQYSRFAKPLLHLPPSENSHVQDQK